MKKIIKGIVFPIIIGIIIGVVFTTFLLWNNGTIEFPTPNGNKVDNNEILSPIIPSPNPIRVVTPVKVLGENDTKKLENVFGFLPYWKMSDSIIPYDKVNTIIYFGISIDKYGRIAKLDSDGNENPGWTKFKSKEFDNIIKTARQNNVKVILALEIMVNDDINAVINNPLARQNTRENIMDLVKQKELDGINIDIEYTGIPEERTIKNFTIFITEFRDYLVKSKINVSLTLDVHADSVIRTRLFELEKIYPYLDQIIIMGYDFFRPTSTNSGPVAPLSGKEKFEYDITTAIEDFTKIIPVNKLILGIPFYGYEWNTETIEPFSKTMPKTGALATYGRTQELIKEKHITPKWDELSSSPYLLFEDKGTLHQVFYENGKSLTKKIDIVKNKNLYGIAIWALGYDGKYPDIWEAIK